MKILSAVQRLGVDMLDQATIYGNDDGADSRRRIMISALLYSIISNLLVGVYLSGLCLGIGGDANYINLVTLLISLCNMSQLIAPVFLERLQKRKPLLLTLRGISHGVSLIIVPLLALSPIPKGGLLVLAIVFLCLAQLLIAFTNPGIQAWHIGCIPLPKRLGYFSFYNLANCVLIYVSLFGAGMLSDFLMATFGQKAGMPILRMLVIPLAALDIWLLARTGEKPYPKAANKLTLKSISKAVGKHPEYLKIIAVAALWNFACNIPSQYFNAYLLEDLKISYTFISSVNLYNIVAVIALTGFWKQRIRNSSLRKTLSYSILFYAVHMIGLFFTTASRIWLYPISIIYSFHFLAALSICYSMTPYLNLPEENTTVYLALYNTLAALAASAGILLSRWLYTVISRWGPLFLGEQFAPARLMMLATFIAMVLCALATERLLRGLDEAL